MKHRSLLIAFLILAACGDDATGDDTPSLGDTLSDRVRFKIGMLIDGDLPDATDGTVNLIELGPATLLEPDEVELLAFEVDDPSDREVTATLLQFAGSESHIRGPVDDGSDVIENELEADPSLCEGLCAGVITVHAMVAVELDDGEVSAAVEVAIAIDCRDNGDEEACHDDEEELICDDVTLGQPALTGDDQVDTYFDAVRTLAVASSLTQLDAADAQDSLRQALELAGDASEIPGELEARIGSATLDGLHVLLGERGCGVRGARILHALRACDPEGAANTVDVECSGRCEDGESCLDADAPGCRGVVQGASCDGSCTGACQAPLDEPSMCEGTCVGTCDGVCANDECSGPCSGLCDGECRALSTSTSCAGSCTGLCDVDGSAICDAPLALYCSGEIDPVTCSGDCFGEVSVEHDSALCQASSIAIGSAAARCEAPIVQLVFGFAEGATSEEQASFADLVGDIDRPVATLLALLGRVELLLSASVDLQDAAQAPLADRLVEGELDDGALECAQTTRASAIDWLSDEIAKLEALRDEILALRATLSVFGE